MQDVTGSPPLNTGNNQSHLALITEPTGGIVKAGTVNLPFQTVIGSSFLGGTVTIVMLIRRKMPTVIALYILCIETEFIAVALYHQVKGPL